VFYALVGIGIRQVDIQRGEVDRQQAAQDRQELRKSRERMDNRMDSIFSSSQATYVQLAVLSSGLHDMGVSLTHAVNKNDPDKLSALQSQAKTAQQRVDALSHELLAITMAPQIAQQLRDWKGETKFRIQELHDRAWEDHIHWHEQHPGVSEDENSAQWDAAFDKAEKDAVERLKGIVESADFVRREMVERIPPPQRLPIDVKWDQEFVRAKTDPESIPFEPAAHYLEDLARRVPPEGSR
jgi:hypothetical protein